MFLNNPSLGPESLHYWVEFFRWTVVASTIATCSAVVLIVFGTLRDYDTCEPHRSMPDFKVTNYFLAFATLTFAYAGHSSFPTLQHDMKKPTEFRKSNALGFASKSAKWRNREQN